MIKSSSSSPFKMRSLFLSVEELRRSGGQGEEEEEEEGPSPSALCSSAEVRSRKSSSSDLASASVFSTLLEDNVLTGSP